MVMTTSTETGTAPPEIQTALNRSETDGSHVLNADSSIRLGGLAGFGGAAALIAAFFTYPIFDLPSVDEVESLTNYPELATGRIIENSLYLAALVLWAVHLISIGRAVAARRSAQGETTVARPLAPIVGVIGLVVMATGSLIHIATSELSDRYIAASETVSEGATEQANIVLVWQGAQAIFNTLLVTGAAIAPLAMVVLAWSLIKTQVVGRIAGGVALALAVVASVGGAAGVIGGSDSPGVPAAVLSMTVFHAVVGWRMTRA